jgi:hypothetical protein
MNLVSYVNLARPSWRGVNYVEFMKKLQILLFAWVKLVNTLYFYRGG